MDNLTLIMISAVLTISAVSVIAIYTFNKLVSLEKLKDKKNR